MDMVKNVQRRKCYNKQFVPCQCCSGRGWVNNISLSPGWGKTYICVDCAAAGEIPCPRCRPTKDVRSRKFPVKGSRLRFGHIWEIGI